MEDCLSPPGCHLPEKKEACAVSLAAPGRSPGAARHPDSSPLGNRGQSHVEQAAAFRGQLRRTAEGGGNREGVMTVTTKGIFYK